MSSTRWVEEEQAVRRTDIEIGKHRIRVEWAREKIYSRVSGKRGRGVLDSKSGIQRNVGTAYKDRMSLYSWLALQRKKNKEGRLAPHQAKMLDDLGGVARWRPAFQQTAIVN